MAFTQLNLEEAEQAFQQLVEDQATAQQLSRRVGENTAAIAENASDISSNAASIAAKLTPVGFFAANYSGAVTFASETMGDIHIQRWSPTGLLALTSYGNNGEPIFDTNVGSNTGGVRSRLTFTRNVWLLVNSQYEIGPAPGVQGGVSYATPNRRLYVPMPQEIDADANSVRARTGGTNVVSNVWDIVGIIINSSQNFDRFNTGNNFGCWVFA